MNFTPSKLIKTPADHDAALRRLEDLMQMDPLAGSIEDLEIECLAARVEDYEKRTVGVTSPTLVEAVRFRIEQAELMDSKDIGPWLKTPNSAFANFTPLQIIERGEADRVWRMIYQLETGEPT